MRDRVKWQHILPVCGVLAGGIEPPKIVGRREVGLAGKTFDANKRTILVLAGTNIGLQFRPIGQL